MDVNHNDIESIAYLVGSRQPMNGKSVPDFLDCAVPMDFTGVFLILFFGSMNNYYTTTKVIDRRKKCDLFFFERKDKCDFEYQ